MTVIEEGEQHLESNDLILLHENTDGDLFNHHLNSEETMHKKQSELPEQEVEAHEENLNRGSDNRERERV